MSERVLSPQDLAREAQVNIVAFDRAQVTLKGLAPEEEEAVRRVFSAGVEHLRRISPAIATEIQRQYRLAVLVAQVAKALFTSGRSYSFPAYSGSLGVTWLFPQALKYASDTPTSYSNNSWDIPITAGTKAYILGSDTDWYKTNATVDYRHVILFFENGLIEYGTTPSAQQFRLISEGKSNYLPYAVEPLVEVPVEHNKSIYLYPTPLGAFWVDYNLGVKWYFMPSRTGTARIIPLGLVFYESKFFEDVKWLPSRT
jgi:hypothetical protein